MIMIFFLLYISQNYYILDDLIWLKPNNQRHLGVGKWILCISWLFLIIFFIGVKKLYCSKKLWIKFFFYMNAWFSVRILYFFSNLTYNNNNFCTDSVQNSVSVWIQCQFRTLRYGKCPFYVLILWLFCTFCTHGYYLKFRMLHAFL